ncbi:MAG: hypothetical protein R2711_18440 [Acidimicrobiales bacterium]
MTVWPKGAAVGGLQVSTGADGRFTMASLPQGTYEFHVGRLAYQQRWAGDSLSRSGAASYVATGTCTTAPDPSWGDPCAIAIAVALRG